MALCRTDRPAVACSRSAIQVRHAAAAGTDPTELTRGGRSHADRQSRSTRMKAVILAGGQGSRLSEETGTKPKPMVEIGGLPILWHIMKGYSAHGVNDFIICLGYKGHLIK